MHDSTHFALDVNYDFKMTRTCAYKKEKVLEIGCRSRTPKAKSSGEKVSVHFLLSPPPRSLQRVLIIVFPPRFSRARHPWSGPANASTYTPILSAHYHLPAAMSSAPACPRLHHHSHCRWRRSPPPSVSLGAFGSTALPCTIRGQSPRTMPRSSWAGASAGRRVRWREFSKRLVIRRSRCGHYSLSVAIDC